MFDTYTLRARVYPTIILLFPILLLGVQYSIEFATLIPFFTSSIIVGALWYFLAHLGRTFGKKKEKELWAEWGGAPSIQLLRWRNNEIDDHTKERYHNHLQRLAPVPVLPDHASEMANPAVADGVYQSWNRFLLRNTRDTKKFPLIYKENAGYGYRRNLWGLRPIGIFVLVAIILGNYIHAAYLHQNWQLLGMSANFYFIQGAQIALLLLWIVVIRKDWVKAAAFAYADRLIEAIPTL
ncbi:hypothetical protein QFZ51_005086 [Chitinophaga sp. W3I9]|uniref:hypothetical protein n=1 Tax=unclassified Chitinophaga TaxID=2619133 RepID=UPI003D21626F